MRYKIVAIVGKSGAGKDALMHTILKHQPNYHEIISCTTRPWRAGEVDGVNYHFLEVEDFCLKISNNEMLEYTTFNNWGYGTALDALAEDKINIGVFNPEGIRSLKAISNIDLILISVLCDDKIRLLRQLNREEHPNVKEIIRRYQTDEDDFNSHKDIYCDTINFAVFNNDVDLNKIATELVIPFITDAFGKEQLNDC